MIDPRLLKLLCCPESHQPLQLAEDSLIQTLNTQISNGNLKSRSGHPLKDTLDGGLIREDRKVIYPIVKKLPILLIEEGILLPT